MSSSSLTVVIPCLNEEIAIGDVVREYLAAFPQSAILVVDNGSDDQTAALAEAAGAKVLREHRRGKAMAILAAFEQVDTDLILMVDGDGSYPAAGGQLLVAEYERQPADMLNGIRRVPDTSKTVFRPMHQKGTDFFSKIMNLLFGFQSADIFSGLRLFTRRFYQNVPILSRGFELELEFTVQAADKGFRVREIEVPFQERAKGSFSKLRTFSDGIRILRYLVIAYRDLRPLAFFSIVASSFFLLSVATGLPPIIGFLETGQVSRFPLAVLAASLMVVAILTAQVGFILESSLRHNREAFQVRLRNHKGRS